MINVTQMDRGPKVVVHSGITASATSAVQQSRGHNALILYLDVTAGSGTWTIKIQGKCPGTGTFIDMYQADGDAMAIASATADTAQVYIGIPDEFKIVATEDGDGATVTVAYELLTL